MNTARYAPTPAINRSREIVAAAGSWVRANPGCWRGRAPHHHNYLATDGAPPRAPRRSATAARATRLGSAPRVRARRSARSAVVVVCRELDVVAIHPAPIHMNDEQRYLFDTRGVFTIPGALTPDQVLDQLLHSGCLLPLACWCAWSGS